MRVRDPIGGGRLAGLGVVLLLTATWGLMAAAQTPPPPPSATPTVNVPTPRPTAVPPAVDISGVATPLSELDPSTIGARELTRTLNAMLDELQERVDDVAPGSDAAAVLQDELIGTARLLAGWMQTALTSWSRTTSTAQPTGQTNAPDPEVHWSRVTALEDALYRIVALMRSNHPNLSSAYLDSHLGLGRDGWRQTGFEIDLLTLRALLYKAHRLHDIERLPQRMANLLTLGGVTWHLLLTIVVIVATVWMKRRGPDLLDRVRQSAFRTFDSLRWKRRVVRATSAVEELLAWGSFVIGVIAVRWALGALADEVEVDVLLRLALLYGLYRLAIDATTAMFVAIGRHYDLGVGEAQQQRLERSVRSVLRIVLLLWILGLLASRWIARGAIFAHVSRFAWVVILMVVLRELFRWRTSMIDRFLELSPDSPLAAKVRDSRDHWYGIFIAPAAFVWLTFHAVGTVLRDFMLRFEETQKALAFLFRRKVEKQAEREGYADEVYDDITDEVLAAFDESAIDRGPLVVAHFPELEELQKQVSEWRRTGIGGAAIVQGERGIGKTSWLNQLRRKDVQVTRIELGRRVTSPQALVAELSRKLEIPDTPASIEELATQLESGEQRIVVLDLAQHLFIARIGGYDAFSAFAELVNRTRQQIFWLAAMSKYAWRHLHAVHPDCAVFQRVIALEGWSEEEIRELIQRRAKASGAQFNYADVAVDQLEGVASRARLVESAEGYLRLLWDYSGGNPRIALHFFVRSLDPDRGDRLRVRLFRAPDPARLEAGGEAGLFVLAAIVTHESLSIEDLASVTRSTVGRCHIHVDRLIDLGAARVDDGLIRVTTTWQRAAVRLLRRRNLLPV